MWRAQLRDANEGLRCAQEQCRVERDRVSSRPDHRGFDGRGGCDVVVTMCANPAPPTFDVGLASLFGVIFFFGIGVSVEGAV